MKFSKLDLLKSNIRTAVLAGLIVGLLSFGGILQQTKAQNNSLGVFLTNTKYPVMTFTATSQTLTQKVGAAVGGATVQIYGSATAATLQLKCSNDGGTNYFAVPYSAGTVTSGVIQWVAPGAFTAYAGTPVIYWVNLQGCTNFEVVSSSTFTGTSASVQVTAAPIKGF